MADSPGTGLALGAAVSPMAGMVDFATDPDGCPDPLAAGALLADGAVDPVAAGGTYPAG